MTSFIEQMRVLLDRITQAPNQEAREQAEYDMAQFLQKLGRAPRDYKRAQAGEREPGEEG